MSNTVSATERFTAIPPRIWLTLACVTLVLGSLVAFVSDRYRDNLNREINRDTAYELSANASALNSAIQSRLLLTNGVRLLSSMSLRIRAPYQAAISDLR